MLILFSDEKLLSSLYRLILLFGDGVLGCLSFSSVPTNTRWLPCLDVVPSGVELGFTSTAMERMPHERDRTCPEADAPREQSRRAEPTKAKTSGRTLFEFDSFLLRYRINHTACELYFL